MFIDLCHLGNVGVICVSETVFDCLYTHSLSMLVMQSTTRATQN